MLLKSQVMPCNHQIGCCLENLRSGRAIEKKKSSGCQFSFEAIMGLKGACQKATDN